MSVMVGVRDLVELTFVRTPTLESFISSLMKVEP